MIYAYIQQAKHLWYFTLFERSRKYTGKCNRKVKIFRNLPNPILTHDYSFAAFQVHLVCYGYDYCGYYDYYGLHYYHQLIYSAILPQQHFHQNGGVSYHSIIVESWLRSYSDHFGFLEQRLPGRTGTSQDLAEVCLIGGCIHLTGLIKKIYKLYIIVANMQFAKLI